MVSSVATPNAILKTNEVAAFNSMPAKPMIPAIISKGIKFGKINTSTIRQLRCNKYVNNAITIIENKKPITKIEQILTGRPFLYMIELPEEDRFIIVELQYRGFDEGLKNLIIRMNNKDGTEKILYIPIKDTSLLLENAYLA